jgi:predicted AAA+ superfamily ATPase
MLANLWLLDEVRAWQPNEGEFTRLKQTPNHFLADPALALRLLGIDEETLITGGAESRFDATYGTIVGRMFESLIALSIKTYAEVNDAHVGYLTTRSGSHEIDFIIFKDRKVIAIEVKFSPYVENEDVKHLRWFKEEYSKNLCEAMIIYSGQELYRRPSDGVLVVPASLLTA